MKIQLALKKQYFEEIKAGLKKEEFRLYNDYWKKRLENKHYDELILTLGYPKKEDKEKILTLKYNGYTIKEIRHPHFGSEPVKVFALILIF